MLTIASATALFGQDVSSSSDSLVAGRLIPAGATMVSAWDLPRNPLTDSLPPNKAIASEIKYGFRLFTDTPNEAPALNGNGMTCGNCHLNAGQRERAMPLVGIAGLYPEYNKRSGRLFSLEDRIVECFKRSMDSRKNPARKRAPDSSAAVELTTGTREVLAISAYIAWLSDGIEVGHAPSWRGGTVIAESLQIPLAQLDVKRGKKSFMEKCVTCHGEDGQGKEIGDKKAGPLWGDESWNDGAGAARVYTLAGMIHSFMPYLDPGSLGAREAQEIALFINSRPRPVYPWKNEDFPGGKPPVDAVYYKK